MHDPKMMAQIVGGAGFIAALDQSGGSTPKALKGYGIEESEYSGDEEMFGLIHQMRSRIVTAPSFNGQKVLGAILFEKTMDGDADGTPVPTLLWERGVVPFLKVDKGLADEEDGVQLMKPMPELDALLDRANSRGIFGTKMRSVIQSASKSGIAKVVDQQFEVANRILNKGLMPIVEPEVNIKSADRTQSDEILRDELYRALDARPYGSRVMLKLSIPAQPDLFAPLIAHPNCARVVALSGGFSQDEACAELAKNRGMIASFSRALLQDLRHQQSDDEFDKTLGAAIDKIYTASTLKTVQTGE
ncbi:fructose bisphosphate aldolase [Pacificimonas flava]|uniref:fructose-bisphosphate aldolase n=2 Tax=Pacificimonas TaxID=1960290 RepID=A0A219B8N5_9SPHN|nr:MULTISPECIES: fructose bisphosphate aldolase [Pacificimonas]MBZ6378746.1 fructose bisphosphate aldolase [Pacificimonas aurantium]OWV34750.1 fructose bisphosphate aldolase [Pacificimonas flava]